MTYSTGTWFQDSGRYRTSSANRTMQPGGPGRALAQTLRRPYFFSLHAADLGLPPQYAEPSALYDHAKVTTWRSAVAHEFVGCHFYCLQVGRGDCRSPGRGRTHVHVIGDRNDGPPNVPRGTEQAKPVYDHHGLYGYLARPTEQPNPKALEDYERTLLIHGKLPRRRGFRLNRARKEWHNNLAVLPSTPHPLPLPNVHHFDQEVLSPDAVVRHWSPVDSGTCCAGRISRDRFVPAASMSGRVEHHNPRKDYFG